MITRALVVLALLIAPASASAATTRYASPTGSGDCSTLATACSLSSAITSAVPGDTVLVTGSQYGSDGHAVAIPFVDKAISVRGAVVGPGRPVVYGRLILEDDAGASASDLDLRDQAPPLVVRANSSADRMVVRSLADENNPEDGCTVSGTLTNSICLAAGSAVTVSGSAIVRHVTAKSTAGDGIFDFGDDTNTVKASIAIGTNKDISGATGETLIDDDFSGPSAGYGQPTTVTGQVSAEPIFVDGYHQSFTPPSPTLDAAPDVDGDATDHDLDGNLRKLGTHTDIGAYERVRVAPAVVAGAQTTSTADGNTLAGTINTGGGRTTWHFEYGANPVKTTDPQTILGSATSVPVSVPVTGLGDAPTTYRLVAANDVGTATSFPDQTAYRAPTLTAGDPTDITQTTATLNGTVALKGAPSGKVEFVYGAATSPPQTITADGPVRADLTGLTPGTTYQWKLRVTRGSEIFETALGSFTAASPPPASTPTPAPSAEPSAEPSPTPTSAPTKPTFSVSTAGGRKRGQLLLSRKTITLFVRCGDDACGATASGYVTIGKTRYGILAAPRKPLQLEANEEGQVKVTSNRRLRQRVRHYLKLHPKAVAKIHLKGVFKDADGTKITKTLTIKVRRLKK